MKVNVEEGALVKEGDLLFELDTRTLKAQLGQIEAQIRKDQAQIVQAKRDTVRAERPADQGRRHGRAARHQLHDAEGCRGAARGRRGQRQNVLTQLSYTEIRAPVSGRIGSISSKAGTVVRIGDNTRDERARHHQPGRSDLRVLRDPAGLPARSARRDGQGRRSRSTPSSTRPSKQSGAMAFIENTVDPNTGTVTAKARIANANEGLWPGQFVKVEVVLGIEPEAHLGPGAGRPARPAGRLRVRRQGRRRRGPAGGHQAHAGRRIGDRQRPARRRVGRGRRPAPPGQRRRGRRAAGPGEPQPRTDRRRRRRAADRHGDRTCFQPSASAAR